MPHRTVEQVDKRTFYLVTAGLTDVTVATGTQPLKLTYTHTHTHRPVGCVEQR